MESHDEPSWPLPSSDTGTRRDVAVNSTVDTATNERTTDLPSPHHVQSQDETSETSKTHSSPESVMNEKTDSSLSPCLTTPKEAHTNTNINTNTNSDTFMTSNAPLTFLQRKSRFTSRYRYTLLSQTSLRNSLLPLAGFLELANAGDFAANVFNDVPVPTFAAALMGIGGCVALFFAVIAVYDARLAWQNVCVLRRERQTLQSLSSSRPQHQHRQHRQRRGKGNTESALHTDAAEKSLEVTNISTALPPSSPSSPSPPGAANSHALALALRVYTDVNHFELLTELIDRFLMDVTLGFGGLLVGVGTLMAIGGANRKVFLASNLLSGYIGNGPAALAGLIRAVWSAYVYHRASRHQRTARLALQAKPAQPPNKAGAPPHHQTGSAIVQSAALRSYNRRYRMVKIYAILVGPTSLVAGAASTITATRWWGYTLLAPCVALAWLCNWLFRRYVGYTRPIPIPGAVSSSINDVDDEEQQRQSGMMGSVRYLLAQIDQDQLIRHLTDAIETRKSLETAQTKTQTKMKTEAEAASRTSIFTSLTKLNLLEPFYLALLTSPPIGREKLQAATLDLRKEKQQIPPTTQSSTNFNGNSNSSSNSQSISSPSPTITIDDPEYLLSKLLRIATSPSPSSSSSSSKTTTEGVASVPALAPPPVPTPAPAAPSQPHNEKRFQEIDNQDEKETEIELDTDDITTTALSVLSAHGLLHARHRERYIIEFLGCWIHHTHHLHHSPSAGSAGSAMTNQSEKKTQKT
ncbi:hypothetical protein LTR20_005031 [Exophiala xenobiotica]|nr:hypothetical protein LTR41_004036 [Exophiala xenobiotica]KAK5280019.1 hypothetical protein LTR40_006967 [Exophiala xenobiotica]KAK5387974.1 hypothetical protein LTS13_000910 [Exophiala xenobiotica]KAK5398062.1 hypothetical protein LTR79_004344 [Exophiala xenobiotica]KAK5417868.1 hypothetical protein LTR90_005042 [Exophiala xenobiotica]